MLDATVWPGFSRSETAPTGFVGSRSETALTGFVGAVSDRDGLDLIDDHHGSNPDRIPMGILACLVHQTSPDRIGNNISGDARQILFASDSMIMKTRLPNGFADAQGAQSFDIPHTR